MDDWLQAGTAEGAGEAEQMDRLEHAGLAAAVGAVEDVDAGGGERVTGCRLRTAVTVIRLRDIKDASA